MTSFLSLKNTQGKMQLITQFGIYFGEFFSATCLHRLRKDWNEESATMIFAFPYRKAVAAPILRPQSIILKPFFSSISTTDETCYASL